MMQIRCQRCGWSFTLSQEALAAIMEEIGDKKVTHYTMDCPKCRHSIKVQSKRLRRAYHPVEREE
jgi:hypothetical protein